MREAVADPGRAWGRVWHKYQPKIRRWCRKRGMRPDDASDVCQDVFLSAFQNTKVFRFLVGQKSFLFWLIQAMRTCMHRTTTRESRRARARAHAAILSLKHQAIWPRYRHASESDSAPLPDLDRALSDVRRAVQPRTWEMFVRLVVDEVPADSLANELGIDVASVYVAKSRVVRRLRARLATIAAGKP